MIYSKEKSYLVDIPLLSNSIHFKNETLLHGGNYQIPKSKLIKLKNGLPSPQILIPPKIVPKTTRQATNEYECLI